MKALIQVTEQRATELETYADYLLHEVFREFVCSDSVLHLRVFIEDAYESCVGPNDANLDSYSMMRVIEKTYESLNMTLDSLPHEIVVICEKDGFTQEMKTMREAEDAARKVLQCICFIVLETFIYNSLQIQFCFHMNIFFLFFL